MTLAAMAEKSDGDPAGLLLFIAGIIVIAVFAYVQYLRSTITMLEGFLKEWEELAEEEEDERS